MPHISLDMKFKNILVFFTIPSPFITILREKHLKQLLVRIIIFHPECDNYFLST